MSNSKPIKRRVVCSACRATTEEGEEIILAGARHFDGVMRSQQVALDEYFESRLGDWDQGFIDQFGVFMDRYEAMRVAKDAGQQIDLKRNGDDTMLYSEGLY